jgi:hypothetical protein
MKKDKAESSQKYCECEYIKQTDTDIVDLFRPPVLMPIDQIPRMLYMSLKKKFLIVFPMEDRDLEFSSNDCPKCFRLILELKDAQKVSTLVAKQEVPAWVRK